MSVRASLGTLVFGMEGPFSATVLERLLAAGERIRALVLPSHPGPARSAWELPVSAFGEASAVAMAVGAGIPVERLPRLDGAAIDRLGGYRPDVVLVACFPFRIPEALFRRMGRDALNLHPSLLPAYRGPAPLFWQFRAGERDGGVTLHRLTEHIDAGPVVAQAPYAFGHGIANYQASLELGRLGGELAVHALGQLRAGPLPVRAQDQTASSYFPWPRAEDFSIPVEWSAQRAFNFIRGTLHWQQPYFIAAADRSYTVTRALGCNGERLGKPYVRRDRSLQIQCTPGILQLEVD